MQPLRMYEPTIKPKSTRRRGKRLPKFLREDEQAKLLETARILTLASTCAGKAHAARRDRVILHLGLYCGLRISEMCHLLIEHINLTTRTLFVSQGKGGKDRNIPIPAAALEILRDWIGGLTAGPMFENSKGFTVGIGTFEWRMARLGQIAGMPHKLKPHTLRHTFAVRLIEKGAGIHEVRDLLGHSSVAITDVYLHCVPDRLRDAVDRL